MSSDRQYDVVVFGASGYTGRLVAEYLNNEYPDADFTWAMAGRSIEKLSSVRAEMGIPESIPLIAVDSDDPKSLEAMVTSTRVVITTVGPYQLYGEELVKQCAIHGSDYVDLSGEPAWMHHTIEAYHAMARDSGARIVHSCGFDSIPFDLGVFHLQAHAKSVTGSSVSRVKGRVRAMNGSFSGGTIASLRATMAAASKDPGIITTLLNPFALTQGFTGPTQPNGDQPCYDDELQSWSAPFIMATINSKNVHRSNFLMGHPYGEDFAYDEMLLTGDGDQGKAAAEFVARDNSLAESPLQPGEGPSKEEREAGNYEALFVAQGASGELLMTSVTGDRDPGYGSTSKMLAESALCLLKNPDMGSGGVQTPAAAMGQALIDRLQAHAGLTFKIESP